MSHFFIGFSTANPAIFGQAPSPKSGAVGLQVGHAEVHEADGVVLAHLFGGEKPAEHRKGNPGKMVVLWEKQHGTMVILREKQGLEMSQLNITQLLGI